MIDPFVKNPNALFLAFLEEKDEDIIYQLKKYDEKQKRTIFLMSKEKQDSVKK